MQRVAGPSQPALERPELRSKAATASGAVRVRTVPLLSVEDIDAASKKSLDYRKPGG